MRFEPARRSRALFGVSTPRGRATIDNKPEVPDPLNGGLATSDRVGVGSLAGDTE